MFKVDKPWLRFNAVILHPPRLDIAPFNAHRCPVSTPQLFSLVYISTAARRVGLNDIEHLLVSAQRRNQTEGVTGLLLYASGSFMQYLEGPQANLARVYAVIKADPLHYGVVDLLRGPVGARLFRDWSMAFHLVDGFGQAASTAQDEWFYECVAGAASDTAPACRLLTNFWQRGRGSLPPVLSAQADERTKLDKRGRFDRGRR